MLTKRIQSFFHAHRLLTQLRSVKRALDSGTMPMLHDLRPLVGLQRLLIREIRRSERKIRRCKALLGASSLSAERVSELRWRIGEFRSDAFLWRSFGDAIAFLFLDKHALKHTYYSVEAPTEKQVAGFLDKEGASNEWAELKRLTDLGIPVLLTDLTNVIRHGDICALFGPDPHLIEIKSGPLNSRGKRQQRDLRQLAAFFSADEADGLHGKTHIRRRTHDREEASYEDILNECIWDAATSGTAVRNPEPGVFYIAMVGEGGDLGATIDRLGLNKPWFFSWNEHKRTRDWSYFRPFVLTIHDAEALLAFIRGELYILVLIEPAALERQASSRGVLIEFPTDDPTVAFTLKRPNGDGRFSTGMPMLERTGYELVSPAWVVDVSIDLFETANPEKASAA